MKLSYQITKFIAPKCAPDDWKDSKGFSCSTYAAYHFCSSSGEIGENTPFGETFLPEFNGYVATDCKQCGCTDDWQTANIEDL